MPSHQHLVNINMGNSLEHSKWGGSSDVRATVLTGNSFVANKPTNFTSPEGSDQLHNNMPPFIALYFCKKG